MSNTRLKNIIENYCTQIEFKIEHEKLDVQDIDDLGVSWVIAGKGLQRIIISCIDTESDNAHWQILFCYQIPNELFNLGGSVLQPQAVFKHDSIVLLQTDYLPRINRDENNIPELYKKVTDLNTYIVNFASPLIKTLKLLHQKLNCSHGDLTESNILIEPDSGKAFIIDFEKTETLENNAESSWKKLLDLKELMRSLIWHLEVSTENAIFNSASDETEEFTRTMKKLMNVIPDDAGDLDKDKLNTIYNETLVKLNILCSPNPTKMEDIKDSPRPFKKQRL